MRDLEQCLPFIEHLRLEHVHFNRLLRQLCEQFHNLQQNYSPAARTEVAANVAQLRRELKRHFEAEEAGGYLEEAVARCPSVAKETDLLELAHPELLAELGRLEERVLAPTIEPPPASELRRAFEAFALHLAQHEEGEKRVMAHGFAFNLDDDGGV